MSWKKRFTTVEDSVLQVSGSKVKITGQPAMLPTPRERLRSRRTVLAVDQNTENSTLRLLIALERTPHPACQSCGESTAPGSQDATREMPTKAWTPCTISRIHGRSLHTCHSGRRRQSARYSWRHTPLAPPGKARAESGTRKCGRRQTIRIHMLQFGITASHSSLLLFRCRSLPKSGPCPSTPDCGGYDSISKKRGHRLDDCGSVPVAASFRRIDFSVRSGDSGRCGYSSLLLHGYPLSLLAMPGSSRYRASAIRFIWQMQKDVEKTRIGARLRGTLRALIYVYEDRSPIP